MEAINCRAAPRPGALIPILALVLSASSCKYAIPDLRVAIGNSDTDRGRNQTATYQYLEALDGGLYPQRILYDLGNVYSSLGESNAALDAWELALEAARLGKPDDEVLFDAWFNRGVFLFQRGRFAEAYEDFRRALEKRPGSMDAKINLELSLLYMNRPEEQAAGNRDSTLASPEADRGSTTQRILEYVRQREVQFWSSNAGASSASSGEDY